MPIFIQLVVSQFEFIKGDDLLHPLGPLGGAVRVDVDPGGRVGVGLPGHHPAAGMECISVINKSRIVQNFERDGESERQIH